MYLDPDWLSPKFQQRIVRWLEANGCRHLIALEPIVIKGKYAEYTALCRKDHRSLMRMSVIDDEAVPLGRKRLRLRIPLREVA